MMIIDSHLHLPADFPDFPAKRAALLHELKRNGVDRGIVIADSAPESTIGSVRDCAALFRGDRIIKVVADISPYFSFTEQLALCRILLYTATAFIRRLCNALIPSQTVRMCILIFHLWRMIRKSCRRSNLLRKPQSAGYRSGFCSAPISAAAPSAHILISLPHWISQRRRVRG